MALFDNRDLDKALEAAGLNASFGGLDVADVVNGDLSNIADIAPEFLQQPVQAAIDNNIADNNSSANEFTTGYAGGYKVNDGPWRGVPDNDVAISMASQEAQQRITQNNDVTKEQVAEQIFDRMMSMTVDGNAGTKTVISTMEDVINRGIDTGKPPQDIALEIRNILNNTKANNPERIAEIEALGRDHFASRDEMQAAVMQQFQEYGATRNINIAPEALEAMQQASATRTEERELSPEQKAEREERRQQTLAGLAEQYPEIAMLLEILSFFQDMGDPQQEIAEQVGQDLAEAPPLVEHIPNALEGINGVTNIDINTDNVATLPEGITLGGTQMDIGGQQTTLLTGIDDISFGDMQVADADLSTPVTPEAGGMDPAALAAAQSAGRGA